MLGNRCFSFMSYDKAKKENFESDFTEDKVI